MNIALVPSAFHPSLGGVEELTRQLAHALTAAGHRVCVITNRWPRNLPAEERYDGITVYRLPMRTPGECLKSRVSYRVTSAWVTRRLAEILRAERADVMHVQCVGPNGYYAVRAHELTGVPLVVTAQGEFSMDATRVYERSSFMRQVLRACLDAAAAVTGCSGQTLAEIEQFYGQPFGARGRVIYNGIRLDDFAETRPRLHDRPYVLGIGRFVPQKGFDVLIDAFAAAMLEGTELVLAGDGPERAALEARAAERGVGSRVRFFGRADREQAVSLFQHCQFFVLPSRHEPFGIVNLEAMAAGKAVVATRVGGVPEVVVDGETGVLVEPEDVSAMARAMARMSADAEARRRFGEAGRRRAGRFGWDAVASEYLNVYRAAGARPGVSDRPAKGSVAGAGVSV